MPNTSRSRPARHRGLLRTIIFIRGTAFLFCSIISKTGAECSAQGANGQSALVSITASAPSRIDRVMASEPGAYSLLTPSGYPAVRVASVSS